MTKPKNSTPSSPAPALPSGEPVPPAGPGLPPPGASAEVLEGWLRKAQKLLDVMAAASLDLDMLLKAALLIRTQDEKLRASDARSFLAALIRCASLRLYPSREPGGVYLIPRWDKKRDGSNPDRGGYVTTTVVDYRALVELATRGGDVLAVEADVVRDGDYFRAVRGTSPELRHRIPLKRKRGAAIAFWAQVVYQSGHRAFQVLPMDEAVDFGARFGRDNHLWDKPESYDFERMALKTIIRRALNLVPRKSEALRSALAADSDEGSEAVRELTRDPSALPAESHQERIVPPTRSGEVLEEVRAAQAAARPPSPSKATVDARASAPPPAPEPPPLGDADAPPEASAAPAAGLCPGSGRKPLSVTDEAKLGGGGAFAHTCSQCSMEWMSAKKLERMPEHAPQ